MGDDILGRDPSGQALVSDQAASRLDPSGFDPSRDGLVSDLLPKPNGGTCEYCGSQTIDRCLLCGAPQCCPVCCFEEIYNPVGEVL